VLVVEDSPVNQIVAVRALERCGCRTELAADGREALQALTRNHYDAVLMDCQMPGLDGYAATAELRRRETDGRHTLGDRDDRPRHGRRPRALPASRNGRLHQQTHETSSTRRNAQALAATTSRNPRHAPPRTQRTTPARSRDPRKVTNKGEDHARCATARQRSPRSRIARYPIT
jgi:CheY-like chemotaxis protein